MPDQTPPDRGRGHGDLKAASERILREAEGLQVDAVGVEREASGAVSGGVRRVEAGAEEIATARAQFQKASRRLADMLRRQENPNQYGVTGRNMTASWEAMLNHLGAAERGIGQMGDQATAQQLRRLEDLRQRTIRQVPEGMRRRFDPRALGTGRTGQYSDTRTPAADLARMKAEQVARRFEGDVFHGTSAPFEGLPTRRPGGIGVYVSPERGEAASYYGDYQDPNRRVIPMQMRARNMLDITDVSAGGGRQAYDRLLREQGAQGFDIHRPGADAEKVRQALLKRGYDAVKYGERAIIALEDGVLSSTREVRQVVDQGLGQHGPHRLAETSAGSTADFNKQVTADLAREAEALAQHSRDFQRRMAAGDTAPTTAQERAAAQRTLASASGFTPLAARSAGGGGREVLAHINALEQQAASQERAATSAASGEQKATTAVRGKAQQAQRAAEWLDKQNQAMRQAAGAAEGERVAAEIVERKAAAAERAVLALREQNRLMRSAAAAQPLLGPTGQPIARPAAAPRAGAAAVAGAPDESALARAAQWEAGLAGSSREVGRAFNYQIAQTGLLDQSLRKHGALTTEFISAAARGEASYREWGYQIGATAAKFAGWTAVSIPVFAALDGVRKIGEGAMQSASGVATLSRFFKDPKTFDASAARQGFRDVSSGLNVGIGDVADAQGNFARVFHNQADSLKAARVALLATKLDQIDAADSFRYFTAIVQEGQVPIGRLPGLFDQISAAQRRMGARVAETLPAVARSFGAVRNAGGDLNQLIALAATTQVATGQSGTSVGTAFYRGAATFFPRPDNQATLRRFGINPNQGFTQALIEAVHDASKLDGNQRRQLSQAFFGPQYGGRFAALFARGPQLDKALQVTSPSAAKGSAAEELQHQLKRLDEQIAVIGHDLERLGSGLGESGFIDPLKGAGVAIHELFRNTNDLLGLWGKMPTPVQHSLGLILEMVAALRLIRRIPNLGEAIAGRAPALGPFVQESDARRAERLGGTGLRRRLEFLQDDAQRTGLISTRATSRAFTAHARLQEATEQYPIATRTEEQAALIDQLGEAYKKALAEAQGLAGDTDALRREMKFAQADMVEFRAALKRGADPVAFLAARDVYIPSTSDRPSGERPIRADQLGADAPEELRNLLPPPPEDVLRPQPQMKSDLRRAAEARREAARVRLQAAQAQAAARRGEGAGVALSDEARMAAVMNEENVALRRGALLLESASVGAARGAEAASVALRGAGTGIKAATLGLGQLLGGEFLLITAGIEAIPRIYEARKKALAKQQSGIVGSNRQPTSTADRQAYLNQAQAEFAKEGTTGAQVNQYMAGPQGRAYLDAVEKANPELAGYMRGYHQITVAIPRLQDAAAQRGQPVPERYLQEIQGSYNDDFKRYQRGEITKKKLFDLQHFYAEEARKSVEATRGDNRAVEGFLHALNTSRAGVETVSAWKRIGQYSQGQLDLIADRNEGVNAARGLSQGRVIQQLRAIHSLSERATVAQNPDDAKKLAQDAQQRLSTLTQSISDDLQTGLLMAHDQAGRQRAYREALRYTRELPSQAASREQAALAAYQGLHADHTRNVAIVESTSDHFTPQQRQAAQKALDAERGALTTYRRRRLERQTLQRASGQTAQQIADQQRQEALDLDAARTSVTNARLVGDPVQAAKNTIAQLGRAVRSAISRYGAGSKQALDAIQQQEDAYNQSTQAQIDRVQAVAGLNAARASTDAGANAATRQGLLKALGILRHSRNYKGAGDSREIDLLTQLANLDKTQHQGLVDQITAKWNLIEASIDPTDAVAMAKAERDKAAEILRRGGLKGTALTNAKADAKRTQIALTQGRQSEHVDHLDFLVSVGKLTTDQEVAALQRYLTTVKHNKALRQRIQQSIYQLTHGADQQYDVNPANIRLPTITELRRTVAGGARGVTQQNNTQVHITVHGPQDYDRLGRVLERHVKGSGRALARAAGAR